MSQPQLVVQDLAGAHNQDLTKTNARLLKGGSWKKQRIVVVIPSSDLMPAKCALAMWNLAFPPNNGVIRMLALGMEVGDAYTSAVQNILDHPELRDWEFMLTIEADNAPPGDGVVKLVEQMEAHPEFACIGGLYFTKGEGGCAQIWGDPYDMPLNFRPQLPRTDGGLQECVGTGMGFNLWRISMFKDDRLKKPWFKTHKGLNGDGVGTQDLTFWADARKNGYRCAIDTSVRVGHLDYVNDQMW